MNVFEVPLTASQNQTVSVALLNISYRFTLQWRNAAQVWFLDIADDAGNALISGLPLITGANLLHQYQHLDIGGGLFVICDTGADAPTFDNLGQSSHLLFVVAP